MRYARLVIFGIIIGVVLGLVVFVAQAQLWGHYKPYDETVRMDAPFLETVRTKYPDVRLTVKNEDFAESGPNIHVATSPALFFGVFDAKEPTTIFVKEGFIGYYGPPCPWSRSTCYKTQVVYVAPMAADRTSSVIHTEFILPPTDSRFWKIKNASLDSLAWRYDNKEDVRLAILLGCYIGGVTAWLLAMWVFGMFTIPKPQRTTPRVTDQNEPAS